MNDGPGARLLSGTSLCGRRAAWTNTARPPRMAASTDPYLLRTLLWCGPCDVPMHPHPGRGQRTYKCGQGCRRIELPAEAIESVTWTAAERRAHLAAIRAPFRASVLEQLLVKVVVVADAPDDLSFIWRT
ncbi:zinc ribbon domain-containing protein [Micromonospora sp. ATA51]|uniref:zinc ribbon domain-containing protein n=1 Tax=Micromonospora sp. ATA51 TaxID=2806098 RepID=UPI001A4D4D5D|nr:zinc ribbon domain-containing protein [Micromonospora sp. ATA51]MBM0228059.1 zinc ribbon domain-containing protein [Micromonospora sp. ATA51]